MYPGPKIHRPSRRHLSRGSYPVATGCTATVTAAGAVATVTYSRPVIVTGPVPLLVAGNVAVTQATLSPSQVAITFASPLAGQAWDLMGAPPTVFTAQGGVPAGRTGTFPAAPATTTTLLAAHYVSASIYVLQFSTNLTVFTPGMIEVYAFLYSASGGVWTQLITVAQTMADTCTVSATDPEPDDTWIMFLVPPTWIEFALPLATPIVSAIT